MVSSTLIFIQILLSANTLLAYSTTDFLPIGSYQSSNDYYVSMKSATWSDAEEICKANFGQYASTVSIETLDEWNYLKNALQTYGCGTTYWTNGVYDSQSTTWRWAVSEQTISSIGWGNDQPAANPSDISRVLLTYSTPTVASWLTVPNSELRRYICEAPRLAPVPCYSTNDLVILLDSSGSIGNENYEKVKSFANQLAAAFTVQITNRVSLIIFSNSVSTIVNIGSAMGPAGVSAAILAAPYLAGTTNTHLGIDAAVAQFGSSPRNVPRNIVVLTDGESSYPTSTTTSANAASSTGARLFSVGVGSSVNQQELLTIAGGNSNFVFTTSNFDDLVKVLNPLSRVVCTN